MTSALARTEGQQDYFQQSTTTFLTLAIKTWAVMAVGKIKKHKVVKVIFGNEKTAEVLSEKKR